MNIEELKKIVRGNGFQESHGSTTMVIDVETVIDLLDELEAINFTDSSLQLNGVNKISFKEFIREFCVRTETDLWLYKGVTYNDREIDIVYKNYCKKQGF